ncbi:MAG: DUF4345 family protein [Trueperaceae bacterium]|nr:DUF4345 family protein [Trueperaceae bacterium]MCC6310249.1 DUF4345 family protein [Trueperaceae bacterium]MCW5818698.1 DUF4345 family protein [Trueperaceae bacterium]
MNVRSQLIYVSAAITFGLGLLGLVNPIFTANMLGLDIVDPRGLSQVRATFGMLHLALGALIVRGSLQRPGAGVYLRVTALLIGAVAVGRLLSIALDGALTLLNLLFLVSETVALAGVVLAWLDPERRRPNPTPTA